MALLTSPGSAVRSRPGSVPADYGVMLRGVTGNILSGNGSRPNDDIEKVTGRPPITFQDVARRNARAWTLQAVK